MPQKRMECFRLLLKHFCMNRASVFEWHKRFKEGRGGCEGWWEVWEEQGLLCWGFEGVQEEIPSEEASTLQIGSVAFPAEKCTSPQTPSLSQTIWPRLASRQFLTISIVQTLLPVTFGYSLNSEAVVMRQLRRWKRLWRRSLTRLHKRIFMGLSRTCWNVEQVHCCRRRLLRRRLEFPVSTINKSANTKKVCKPI